MRIHSCQVALYASLINKGKQKVAQPQLVHRVYDTNKGRCLQWRGVSIMGGATYRGPEMRRNIDGGLGGSRRSGGTNLKGDCWGWQRDLWRFN